MKNKSGLAQEQEREISKLRERVKKDNVSLILLSSHTMIFIET